MKFIKFKILKFKGNNRFVHEAFLNYIYLEGGIMAYSEKVLDHYENPRNVGTLDKKENSVGTGLVGAPACGDVMRLQIIYLECYS